MNRLIYLSIVALIISCVFDPADKIMHLKLPLFCVCWIFTFLNVLINRKRVTLPLWMIVYLFTILVIPIMSICYYHLINGQSPYDGFLYFKAILFITIIIVLYLSHIDAIKPLCFVLSGLSLVIIFIFVFTYNNPLLTGLLYEFGNDYEVLSLGSRHYGSMEFSTIFYKTSPMISFSIAYFVFMSFKQSGKTKVLYILLSSINIFAMYLAGTRNNILVAICLPLLLFVIKSNHSKIFLITLLSFATFASFFLIGDVIRDMFDTSDVSNSMKLAYLVDYKSIFEQPTKLLFGQGLGSYNYWTAHDDYASITELTFLELFRNYGLFGGSILLVLILYPISMFNLKRNELLSYLLIGYICYLLMSFSNPFLFSSSGMLILAAILSKKTLHGITVLRTLPNAA